MYSEDEAEPTQPSNKTSPLTLSISVSLQKKLIAKAHLEGVTLEELAGELIAEGLVLRAWEIMERKNTMRNGPNTSQGRFQGRNQNYKQGNNQNNYLRNRNINDKDNASFMEYVRSQEKNQRNT